MSPAERLLDRLETVGSTGERRWQSRCPAHDDRRPSLTVTEKTTGDVLLHCHAGCDTADVLAAVGLEAGDLFAERRNGHEPEAVYRYVDEQDRPLFEVVRLPGKQFRQRRPDGQWGLDGARRVIYQLPKIVKAVKAGETIYVAEGEKDVHAIEKAGGVATCNPGGAGKWRPEYGKHLTGAKVIVVADLDEPGQEHAEKVATALKSYAESVEIVSPAAGKDAHDHLRAHGLTDFLSDKSPEDKPKPEREAGPMTRVDGAELLSDLRGFITGFVVLPSDEAADLLALWALHTWTFEAAFATPYLRVTSATADSGKTLLLEILTVLCRRGWHAVNPSVAVLYRKVDQQQPTLLLDEMDNYPMDERRDALAVLNAGYKRGATVDRCKENGDLVEFSCYCPKAYVGLDQKSVVSTLLSRSITVRMERKTGAESVEMWIAPLTEPLAEPLRERCEAWAHHNLDALGVARPDLPAGLVNRAAEVCGRCSPSPTRWEATGRSGRGTRRRRSRPAATSTTRAATP